MEGEGSGYDLIYEKNCRDLKPFPEIISDYNSTRVIQTSKILDEDVVLLIDFIAQHYTLSQKEFIVLGVVARFKKILSTQLSKILQLTDEERLRPYVSRLQEQGILVTRGYKKGTEYLINPSLITSSKINVKPSLKLIEPHRLKALIEEDLKLNPDSSITNIQKRLVDVPIEDVRKMVYKLVKEGILNKTGNSKQTTVYYLAKKNDLIMIFNNDF
jgi:ATP-dependent DNA helicase RecG